MCRMDRTNRSDAGVHDQEKVTVGGVDAGLCACGFCVRVVTGAVWCVERGIADGRWGGVWQIAKIDT
jgi:hypothetical protein